MPEFEDVRLIENIVDRQIAEREQRYRSLFHHNPDAIYSLDLAGNIVEANPALCEMTGFSESDLLTLSYHYFCVPEDLERVNEHFRMAASGEPQDYECAILRTDGSRMDLRVTNLPIIVGGEIVGVYGIARDIGDRKELEDQLRHLAFHDPLTNLPNRLLFMDRLEQALAGLTRRTRAIALFFIDLDNFKVVNDTFGHDVGDRVLIQIADMIQGCVRAGDTVSRLGGDEFTVLLIDVESLAEARSVVERLLARINEPLVINGDTIHVSASIGVVMSRSPRDDAGALIHRADLAMYQAKAGGKAHYRIFERPRRQTSG